MRFKQLLNFKNQASLDGVNVRCHVKTGVGDDESVQFIEQVFGIVNDEHDGNVNPVPSKKVNEGR